MIYYGNGVIYENGFLFNDKDVNEFRKDIEFINIENNTFYSSSYLEIKADSKVEINLLPPTESLAHFFDSNYDINMKNVVSIDFTYFNSSSIIDINSLFKNYVSLETIIFSNFNISLVNNMNELFTGCSNLTEIDLSMLNTTLVIDMHNMFYGCTNLKLIDLYNVKMDNLITAHKMFKNLDNLKYIDLIDVDNSVNNITETELNIKDDLIVCQKEIIITNINAKYQCCYYNTINGICESDSYIILIYRENVTYESGFVIENEKNIEFRNNMLYVVSNRKIINNKEKLDILPNTKIEIHFSSDITTLENFFDSNYDENVEYIEKVDLFSFNSSNLEIMSHLFNGCKSLKSIDFTGFDSSKATDISYMFSGCSSIEYINLTNFNTELLANMSHLFYGCNSITSFYLSTFNTKNVGGMFSGCNSTKLINLSNFNTESTTDMSNMFYGCDNLEILDISNFNLEKC